MEQDRQAHPFWGKQPVNRSPTATTTGEMQSELTLADFTVPPPYRSQPFALADKEKWLPQVHALLLHDEDSSDDEAAADSPFVALFNRAYLIGFNFKPSESFHDYILTGSPMPAYYIGLYHGQPESLVAFISAIEIVIRVDQKELRAVEVHSLCISPAHRSKRLVPAMLGALYSLVAPRRIKQAVFSTATPLPMTPISRAVHWGRPVDAAICYKAGYMSKPQNESAEALLSRFALPSSPLHSSLRPATSADAAACHALCHTHMQRFRLAPVMDAAEFQFRVMPRAPWLHCWVLPGETPGSISAFVCLYISETKWYIPRPTITPIACLGYFAHAPSISLTDLLTAVLHCTASIGCPLLVATDVGGLAPVLPALGFDELRHSEILYQLYNFQCPAMAKEEVALQFW